MEGTAEQTLISFIFVVFSSAAEYQEKRRRQVVEKFANFDSRQDSDWRAIFKPTRGEKG